MPRTATARSLPLVAAGVLLASACGAPAGRDASGTRSEPTPTSTRESTVTSSPEPSSQPSPSSPLLAAVGAGAADGAEPGVLDEVRVLLARGARTDARDAEGRTARELAGDLGLARTAALLGRADDPVADPGAYLLRAAADGNADDVALALRAGAGTEVRDDRRRTPLLLCVIGNHLNAAEVLVAAGADPDAVDDQSDTPWLVTGVTGAVPMARLLHSADPDLTLRNRYGGVSIIPASERGHVDYVRWVTRHTDIDVDHVNDLGWTALLEAVVLGEGTRPWQQVVRLLLDAGADPVLADRDGVTPLAHARERGYAEIVALLER